MSQATRVLVAKSALEERLFLLTERCASCASGPLALVKRRPVERFEGRDGGEGPPRRVVIDEVRVRCPRCGALGEYRFDASTFAGGPESPGVTPLPDATGTAATPSALLDRVAWVRWARIYAAAFAGRGIPAVKLPGDRKVYALVALRCLDEALKFLPHGGGEPGEAGLRSRGSRAAYRSAPRSFGRIELLGKKLELSLLLAADGVAPDEAWPVGAGTGSAAGAALATGADRADGKDGSEADGGSRVPATRQASVPRCARPHRKGPAAAEPALPISCAGGGAALSSGMRPRTALLVAAFILVLALLGASALAVLAAYVRTAAPPT